MTQAISLHDILNDMARHPERIRVEEGIQDRKVDLDLADILPFLGSDPVILDLYKHYLDAKAEYQSTVLDRGKADPLAEIAADFLDSSWCALQSRLYELRQNRAAAARVSLLKKMEHEAFEARQEQRAWALRDQQEFLTREQSAARLAREQREGAAFFWWLVAYVFIMRQAGGSVSGGGWRTMSPALAGVAA